MNINQLIETGIYLCFSVILFMSLYKQWFQFSPKATFTVASGLAFADAFIPIAAPPGRGWIIALVSCSTIFVGAFMMRKGTRCKMLILYIIQVFVYNILGVAMIAVMTVCYGLLTGKSSQTWFVDTTMTQTDHFMKWIGMVLSYCAALWICKKCISLLESLSKKEQCFFSSALIIPDILFLAASRSFIVSDDQMLAGIFVTLYGIFTIWLAIVISLVLLIPFLRLRRENHMLQEQMEAQYLYYTKVLEMQSQLREIRHDLKNRLIVETMLREEVRNDRCTD